MDIDPPTEATTEVKTQLLPTPYQVKLYDQGSLFAGKLGASTLVEVARHLDPNQVMNPAVLLDPTDRLSV